MSPDTVGMDNVRTSSAISLEVHPCSVCIGHTALCLYLWADQFLLHFIMHPLKYRASEHSPQRWEKQWAFIIWVNEHAIKQPTYRWSGGQESSCGNRCQCVTHVVPKKLQQKLEHRYLWDEAITVIKGTVESQVFTSTLSFMDNRLLNHITRTYWERCK